VGQVWWMRALISCRQLRRVTGRTELLTSGGMLFYVAWCGSAREYDAVVDPGAE
jgi:hypothetical protein